MLKEEYIMMKVNEFIDTLTRIEKEPTKYLSGGWGHYIDGKWCFDCICLIKSVLWGFNFNKNKLINETLDKYYDTFSHTLDTTDFVPEKYNKKI